MAALSDNKARSGGEERYQIISSLLDSKVIADSADRDEQLDLWQARMVLAIAEILILPKPPSVPPMVKVIVIILVVLIVL